MRKRSDAALRRLQLDAAACDTWSDASSLSFGLAGMERAVRRQVFLADGTPGWLGLVAALVLGVAAAAALPLLFPGSVRWTEAAAALGLAGLSALGNVGAAGQTDVNLAGSCGQLALLLLAAWARRPAGAAAALIGAGACSAAAHGAALAMYALRCGYVVYASVLAVFIGQVCGVVGGCLIAPAALLLYQSQAGPGDVGMAGGAFPAPLASEWRANAAAFSQHGLAALPAHAGWTAAVGGAVGVLLAGLRRALPKARGAVPLPAAMAVAVLAGANVAVDVTAGAAAVLVWRWRYPRSADAYTTVVAGALIAGQGLWGVAVGFMSAWAVKPPICMSFSS